MADTDAVTWGELDKFCDEKRTNCHALMDQRHQNHVQKVETERRGGMLELQTALDKLSGEVAALKNLLSQHSAYILPKPILYLVCAGMIGVGVAGEKLINVILKHFGAG